MGFDKRLAAIGILVAAALAITGCMLVPGKFASELELHRDGRFTYRYDGEIYLLALSKLAEAGAALGEDGESEFVAQPCYDESDWENDDWKADDVSELQDADVSELQDADEGDDDVPIVIAQIPDPDAAAQDAAEAVGDAAEEAEEAMEDEDDYVLKERECTAEELAEQREEYDERKKRKRKEAEQQAQLMNLFFGGLDPSDPEAAAELVKRLKRQRGWKKVEYLGDGKFDVSFEISATMGHDFVFPTFERFPLNNFILTAAVREPNTVRLDAPGFAVQGGSGPMGGMMSGMVGVMQIFGNEFGAEDEDEDEMPKFPELRGTFTLLTDGRILANNTDEGPSETAEGMQRLEWIVTPRSRDAPMALIGLD